MSLSRLIRFPHRRPRQEPAGPIASPNEVRLSCIMARTAPGDAVWFHEPETTAFAREGANRFGGLVRERGKWEPVHVHEAQLGQVVAEQKGGGVEGLVWCREEDRAAAKESLAAGLKAELRAMAERVLSDTEEATDDLPAIRGMKQ